MKLLTTLRKTPNNILYVLIYGLRPLLGPDAKCKFTISCTPYALMVLKEESLFKAVKLIVKRLIACNPIF
ncbi:hypothetical protein A3F66_04505 [candidate division TM6 bacterium RIFCSPHIGHO2_12_FULL_32_22]|nr:MAG: hypothetical protein A3F66_04505 [candidate division TM6 bacterium RIFCSPHIGHO2_12_FULL_32_22]